MNSEVLEMRCYLYTIINSDRNALFFQWKKHLPNEVRFSKARIEEPLIDSIIVAAERQKKYSNNIISLYDGPLMNIKINHPDGSFELIDFELGNVLFTYLEALYDKDRTESKDSININRKKQQMLNLVWEKDSSIYKGKMTRPFIPS